MHFCTTNPFQKQDTICILLLDLLIRFLKSDSRDTNIGDQDNDLFISETEGLPLKFNTVSAVLEVWALIKSEPAVVANRERVMKVLHELMATR